MISVNNGARVQVTLADFQGVAGFVEQGGGSAQLSYRPISQRVPAEPAGTRMAIDGTMWEVVSSARSAFVRDHRVLTLKRVELEQGGD
jgi:hypothetical protein